MSYNKVRIVAAGDDDLERVRRFRYRMACEEGRGSVPFADHARKTIGDPLDIASHILLAVADDSIVGTIRCSLITRNILDFCSGVYGVLPLNPAVAAQSFTSRLAVLQCRRSLEAFDLLVKAAFQWGLEVGVKHDHTACRPESIPLLKRYGWRPAPRSPQGPPELQPMRLDFEDRLALESCGSPFVKMMAERPRIL
jgi:hypothetical protein